MKKFWNATGNDSDEEGNEKKVAPVLEFSLDEDVFEKCGVKKPKFMKDLETADGEKIYRYQLERDLLKIKAHSGEFDDKVNAFVAERLEKDVVFRMLSETKSLGMYGRYGEVADITSEISWRSTTKLTGELFGAHLQQPPIIAAKRYKEWLSGKPKGPSKEFLRDKEQRKIDNELWDEIKFARHEKTRVELREESKERSRLRALERIKEKEEMLKANKKNKDDANKNVEEELEQANQAKKELISLNKFGDLRKVPSKVQANRSMRDWDKGIKENWDFDANSFGKYVVTITGTDGKADSRLSAELLNFASDQCYELPKVFSSGTFFKMDDEMAAEFSTYVVETNLKKAEYFVSVERLKAKQREKAERKRKEAEERARRRVNLIDAAQNRVDMLMATTANRLQNVTAIANFQEAKTKKKKKKFSGDDSDEDEGSEDGDDADSVEDHDSVSATTKPDGDAASIETGAVPVPADGKQTGHVGDGAGNVSSKMRKKQTTSSSSAMSLLNLRKHYKKTSRWFRRRWGKIKYYSQSDNRGKLLKIIKHMECIFGKYKKKKAIAPEEVAPEASISSGDFVEVEVASGRKLREWEKFSEEDLAAMEIGERKRLKKMRKKDESEDRKKEAEAAKQALQKRIDASKKEQAARKKAEVPLLQRMWDTLKSKITGEKPAYLLTSVEAKKKAAAAAAKKLLEDEADNDRAMDSLFAFRERQRQAASLYNDVLKMFTGIDRSTDNVEYNVDELIRFSRLGMYAEVIDVLDHFSTPISPNAVNSDGDSAFYVVLLMVLNNEAAEQEADLSDRTCFQALKACVSNGIKGGKLDLVLKILYYKGGDVNFLKDDKDVDGIAILHEAARVGGVGMISWLHKRKARFDIRTKTLQRTPLMYAARAGQMNAMLYLLKKGAMPSINVVDVNGWTALHFAAAFSTPDIAQVLMICGANQYARSGSGSQPVDEAANRKKQGMVECLRTFKNPDLLHRRLMNFFEIKYMHKAKETVPDAVQSDAGDDDMADEELLAETEDAAAAATANTVAAAGGGVEAEP